MPGPKKGSPKRIVQVAGARVNDGELDRNLKFRVLRNNFCIVEDLKVNTLKKFKQDVDKVEQGLECGIALEGLKKQGVALENDDIIECYREQEAVKDKFVMKAGVIKSY